ncbi:hypothetical protein H257_08288 [Aphanomyces astaci]|uniref:WRKY19-like zinc finger domain-containing protein n=1 Tax=Aphanomyces astaci TaxID=112090 RepID=W4GEK1_APHAT|nr:hypothetical protein H257_08288 [Aphanomyces astaci]ETV78080.1 hypothetical protein H257_08288 [Aphanomyces astaci]|eukprot:XP_009832417.1 hypothetical protein H257_08288 [Aphanomyces astaci]
MTTCGFNGCPHAPLPHPTMLVPEAPPEMRHRRLLQSSGNARVGSYCCKHSASSTKTTCVVDGCTKTARARHRCVAHGGGRNCTVGGCKAHTRQRGLCQRHSRQKEVAASNAIDFDYQRELAELCTKSTVDMAYDVVELELPRLP